MLRSSLRAAALIVSLPVLAAVALAAPTASATSAVTKVTADDLGTVNYDGGGAWPVATPSGGFDSTPLSLFTDKPTDGGRWTLDDEGKLPGTTTVTPAGLVLYVDGEPSSGNYAISQKVRYSYFPGSGGYPAIDSQLRNGVLGVPDFFASTFSYTGSWVKDSPDTIFGDPSLDLRLQNPTSFQRVSLHSNGDGSPVLSSATSTVNSSLDSHFWKINSTAEGHTGGTSVSVATLKTDFAGWDVVSFGFNVGRGAEGTVTIQSVSALGQTFNFAPASLPVITGTASVGSTLSASRGDFASDVAVTYQWLRGDAVVATTQTYVPTSADIGSTLTVRVTGARLAKTVVHDSAATSAVVAAGISSHPVPTIAGTPKVGSTLTAIPGTWDAGVALSYQWLRGSAVIAGATNSTYIVVAKDLKASLSVTVTGAKVGVAAVTSKSTSGKAVIAGTLKPTPTPTVGGTAKVGKKLSGKAGKWAAGTKLSYQWYRGAAKIAKATGVSYKLVAADKGKKLTLKVTGAKVGYITVTKSSKTTAKVA